MQMMGKGNWDGIANTHRQYKDMTATILPTHASNARRQLQAHCQHTTAMQGSNSDYSALHMQAIGEGDHNCIANTRKQCKMTVLVVAAHANHRRRQLGWHCKHMQNNHSSNHDSHANTSKQCKITATPAWMHASHSRRQLQLACQPTQAMQGGNSHYRQHMQAIVNGNWDSTAERQKQCKKVGLIIAPNTYKP